MRPPSRTVAGLAVMAIAASCTLSLIWVFVVPMFQTPDEDVHFDYAISLYTAKRLLFAREKPVAEISLASPYVPKVHPFTWHLMVRTRALEMRGNPRVAAARDYGSISFFKRTDLERPTVTVPYKNPWLITEYPVAYYALAAAWMRAISPRGGSLSLTFFAARILSVVLLAAGLCAAFRIVRILGMPPVRAVLFIAAVGLFPLTSFVSSAIQPDNLAFALVNIAVLLALEIQQSHPLRTRRWLTIALGLCLALLTITKYHTALCVLIAALAAVFYRTWRMERRELFRTALTILTPIVLAAALQAAINWGGHAQLRNLGSYSSAATRVPPGMAFRVKAAIVDYIGGGTTFHGFWGLFGWNDTALVIVNHRFNTTLRRAILWVTWIVIAAALLRVMHVWLRLFRLHRHRPTGTAIGALLSNVFLNSYLLFAALMLALYVITGNGFTAQGRNWYPFITGIFWLGVWYAPGLFRGRVRESLRWLLLSLILSYSLASVYYGLAAVVHRFYP